MNEIWVGAGVIVVLTLLAIAWLAFHPDFGSPPERPRTPILEPDDWRAAFEVGNGADHGDPGRLHTESILKNMGIPPIDLSHRTWK